MTKAIALTLLYAALAFGTAKAVKLVLIEARQPVAVPLGIQYHVRARTAEPSTNAYRPARTACTYECFEKCNAEKRGCMGDYETQTACQHERAQ